MTNPHALLAVAAVLLVVALGLAGCSDEGNPVVPNAGGGTGYFNNASYSSSATIRLAISNSRASPICDWPRASSLTRRST